MRNKIETGSRDSEEGNINYRENAEKLIAPFITIGDKNLKTGPNSKIYAANAIAGFLDMSEKKILKGLRLDDEVSYMLSNSIKIIRKLLKEKRISKNAPWLDKLEEKMVTMELYAASTDYEMNLEKGKREFEKRISGIDPNKKIN